MNASTPPERMALAAHDPEDTNTSANPSFQDVLDARLSRRGAMRLGIGTAGAAVLGSVGLPACGGGSGGGGPAAAGGVGTPLALQFAAVPKSTADQVTVPAGYTARVVHATGDSIGAAAATFANDGNDANWDSRVGDQHDGMEYFGLNAAGTGPDRAGSERGLLAMNHEAIVDLFMHPNGATAAPRPAAEADKEMAAHGLSVVEVRRGNGTFSYVANSPFNRRVTPLTPIQLNGPARGNALMVTKFSAAGTTTRGTINNCGTGITPWGTYLSGEENWNGYFARGGADNATRNALGAAGVRSVASLARYGIAQGQVGRHAWETVPGGADAYVRWNVTLDNAQPADGSNDYRNEANTYGYIVEMDPYDGAQAIRKRTALGRFAHESAAFGLRVEGRPLALYMGDDSRGEYIYKYVSTAAWTAGDATPANRITTGDKYLDDGKLYVAKFNADGSGEWVELNIANAAIAAYAPYDFADQADVLVNARLAADAVGATKMDRPEWCAVHPVTGEIYYTLTNNSNRKVEPTATQQLVDAANPRVYTDSRNGGAQSAPGNLYGHIIRMREAGGSSTATTFTWDVYLYGAQSARDGNSPLTAEQYLARVNLSALTSEQDFSSPDGLWFSPKTGVAYIQTDDGQYTDVTNCMMLAGLPGAVGDGTVVPIQYTRADTTTFTVAARVGARPTSQTLRRFLVGPKDCEITGIAETPDGKALFVNIQHPGEGTAAANIGNPAAFTSHWPGNAGHGAGGANARPRSATIVITRDDGGVIGVDGTAFLNGY